MDAALNWGIPIIAWLQSLGAWLTTPMTVFTFVGSEQFYLLVMPAVLWCFDAAIGLRLGLILLTSDSLNGVLKLAFGWPRPYWVSTQVHALAGESSFGIPSGHAQGALVLWGRLASELRRRMWTIVLALLILLISVSRLYLGVHFPTDTLGGWVAGGVLLIGFLALDRPVRSWLALLPLWGRLLVPILGSFVMVALGLAVAAATASRVVPETWVQNAAAAIPSAEPIHPQDVSGILASAGTLLGFGTGGVLLYHWGGFDARGIWWRRALRLAVGLAGVVVIYFGLQVVFPEGASAVASALRFVRYAAVGFWVAFLGPRLFSWLKVA